MAEIATIIVDQRASIWYRNWL